MKPTYLYIKIHSKTNLLYLGKTVKDPEKYLGSGIYWLNHIKKHGKEYVKTIWKSNIYIDEVLLKEDALKISKFFNIENNSKFANLIPENGINGGGDCSQMHTQEVRIKVQNTMLKNYGVKNLMENPLNFEKHNKKLVEKYGKTFSDFAKSAECINKRNQTNLELYGSKCPANKNGNINSKLTQQRNLNRKIVKQIRCVTTVNNKSLKLNWFHKSEEDLQTLYNNLLKIKPNIKLDTQRNIKINSKIVVILRMVNNIHKLNLGINWFQKSEKELVEIYNKFKNIYSEEFDIALQTYDQYFLKFL